ncbi:hypothetical protein TIFTF001_037086 [Ficus carica]|uniref:Uncharacterized protein n=1 Tax=Ficus carica TaxID=3494 RepID=A0AA88E4M6_FICCA|nr:hypothetical protein TIFTF001_037086 [Ficus carica]
MFLVSWADMAHSKPLSLLPSFRRSLFNPRHPGRIHPSLDDMYVPVTALPPPKDVSAAVAEDHLISRIYYINAEQLERLQALCNKSTKLESFSAFLWKIVADCAASDDVDKVCKMGIVVDGRRRLSTIDDEDKGFNLTRSTGRMMESYFGNVLSIPFGGKKVEELVEKPLSWVAGEVHEFLQGAVTKEHFLGLIDWVEMQRPVQGLARIYCRGSEDGPAFVVSSGQQFPVSKIDFGWGKPVFGSYHFLWGGGAGYVMPMPSPAGNGDWVVYMHMPKKQLEIIETEASNVFRPFTFNCLNVRN